MQQESAPFSPSAAALADERLDAAIPFAEQHDWIYATIGIHPHDAKTPPTHTFQRLEELTHHPRVIAWGEMGLDYYYDHSPRDVQQQVFRRQLASGARREAARSSSIAATRGPIAWRSWSRIGRPTGLGGIFHCFTATLDEARRGLDMGFMISFAGNVTYPKMQPLRDVARELPLDRMLTETDSPFLSPQGRRGKRNEPAFVVEVAQALANVRNLAPEKVAATTAANFRRFFQLECTAAGCARRLR